MNKFVQTNIIEEAVSKCPLVTLAPKAKVAKQNYILVGERYKENFHISSKWPLVAIGELCELRVEKIITEAKYSLQGTTQSRYLTGGVPPVRFSM